MPDPQLLGMMIFANLDPLKRIGVVGDMPRLQPSNQGGIRPSPGDAIGGQDLTDSFKLNDSAAEFRVQCRIAPAVR